MLLLNTKFSLRVDLNRKIIEHASPVEQDGPEFEQRLDDLAVAALDEAENANKKQKYD